MANCQSCNIEMKNPVDFAAGNIQNIYCRHCVDDFDELKSYEEVFSNQVGFLMEKDELTQEDAESKVKEQLSKSPVWKNKA